MYKKISERRQQSSNWRCQFQKWSLLFSHDLKTVVIEKVIFRHRQTFHLFLRRFVFRVLLCVCCLFCLLNFLAVHCFVFRSQMKMSSIVVVSFSFFWSSKRRMHCWCIHQRTKQKKIDFFFLSLENYCTHTIDNRSIRSIKKFTFSMHFFFSSSVTELISLLSVLVFFFFCYFRDRKMIMIETWFFLFLCPAVKWIVAY